MLKCGHTGCNFGIDHERGLKNHESNILLHSVHFEKEREACECCQELLRTEAWTEEGNLTPVGRRETICLHMDCDFFSVAANLEQRKLKMRIHEQAISAHMEHFEQAQETVDHCPKCEQLMSEDADPRWTMEYRERVQEWKKTQIMCAHIGCDVFLRNVGEFHEKSYRPHMDHFHNYRDNCEACVKLINDGVWSNSHVENMRRAKEQENQARAAADTQKSAQIQRELETQKLVQQARNAASAEEEKKPRRGSRKAKANNDDEVDEKSKKGRKTAARKAPSPFSSSSGDGLSEELHPARGQGRKRKRADSKKQLPPKKRRAAGGGDPDVTACSHCGVEGTPQWRKGPTGKKDLCNACGVYYMRNRRMKPLIKD